MDFNARFYSQRLGRFISADSLIPNPGSAMDFDRYAYAAGNPLRYIDPTGHWYYDPGCDCLVHTGNPRNEYPEYLNYEPLPTPEYELPPPVPEKYTDQLTDSQWYLARWAYSLYWSDPSRFTYNEFIWQWAWTYWEYSAAYYPLQQPWFTPADQPPFIVSTIGVMGAGLQQSQICGNCGTLRPDLARGSGRLRIDPDGASVYCVNCLKNGETNASSGTYWIRSFKDYEQQAEALNIGPPKYTGDVNNPGHFSVFKGGPTDTNTSIWQFLNQFIRNYVDKYIIKR